MFHKHKFFFGLVLAFSITNFLSYGARNAGVLPYAKKDNTYYFLFGLENRFQDANRSWTKKAGTTLVWADFGGKCDAGDATNAALYNTDQATFCAAREAAEETRYVFGNTLPLRTGLTISSPEFKKSIEYFIKHMKVSFKIDSFYEQFFAEVDFINATKLKNSPKVPHYEKDDYIWVKGQDLLDALQKQDRNGFSKIGQTFIFPTLAKTLRMANVQNYIKKLIAPSIAPVQLPTDLINNLNQLLKQLIDLRTKLQSIYNAR